jgi:hypothetical protein
MRNKAIIAGDSVANGVGVSRDGTTASSLQRLVPAPPHINIGVGGAEDLAPGEMAQGQSIFAGLALFVDIVHLSPRGSELLASRLLGRGVLAGQDPQARAP